MSQNENVPGFFQPLHSSITEPILYLGVPKNFAVLNGTLAALEFLIFESWQPLPMNFIFHLIAVIFHRNDAMAFDCFMDYIKTEERNFIR